VLLAKQVSEEMGDLQATANGEKFETNHTKELRDKAYTLVFDSIQEFRSAGKYLFRKEPDNSFCLLCKAFILCVPLPQNYKKAI
jgi:hypothetical protein